MKAIRSRLYRPRPCEVVADADGVPLRVDGVGVEAIREEWLVQDAWWTDKPLGRHYFELVLASGSDVVTFSEEARDQSTKRWFTQRG